MKPSLDAFFNDAGKWQKEFAMLRKIARAPGLTEELKWGQACYTMDGKNIVLIHGFKDYCALLFFKGALMKDPKKLLIRQTKNVQAGRQIRFTKTGDIKPAILKAYVKEAIAVEKAGLKVKLKKTAEFPMPDELKTQLAKNAALKTAFHALTPGRQRGYILFFSSAKQSETRTARIEKSRKKILAGKGLQD